MVAVLEDDFIGGADDKVWAAAVGFMNLAWIDDGEGGNVGCKMQRPSGVIVGHRFQLVVGVAGFSEDKGAAEPEGAAFGFEGTALKLCFKLFGVHPDGSMRGGESSRLIDQLAWNSWAATQTLIILKGAEDLLDHGPVFFELAINAVVVE